MPHDYRSKITTGTTTMLLQLFYLCYKQGVSDASDVNDNNLCKDFVNRMQDGHRFQIVGKDYFIDWVEWRSIVAMWASRISMRQIANRYFSEIRTYQHYDAVPLRICMDCYVMGVEDFTKFPERIGLEVFLFNDTFNRWRKAWEREPKRKIEHFNDEVVLLINERRRKDECLRSENHEDKRFTMKMGAYKTFLDTFSFVRYELIKRRRKMQGKNKTKRNR